MDPIAAVTHEQPYPYYAQLAARPGLHYDNTLKLWVAAHPAAVRDVMTHPHCRVRPVTEPVPAAIAGGAAGFVFGELVRMNDGARHAAPKLALQRALGSLDPALVQRTAQECAATLARRYPVRTAEGLSAWQCAVPVQTVAHLLGFGDAAQVAGWMGEFVACLSPLSSAEQLQRAHGAAQALLDSLRSLVQSGPARPGSLLSLVLAEAEAAGWNRSDALLANLAGLLSQTYEATAGLIGNAIVALADGMPPESGLEALVLQVLRDDPPIHNTRRFMAEDAVVCNTPLQAGQGILVVLAAAGRAPGTPLFTYGHGVHACPGQALSQAIACAALEVLLASGPLPPLAWRYRPSVNARIPMFVEAQ